MRKKYLCLIVMFVASQVGWHVAMRPMATQAQQVDPTSAPQAAPVLPRPEAPFGGRVSRRAKDSTPDFPREVTAPKGAPNILVILTDDVGFAATSPFGGPIPTQTFDRLAQNGLRYTQFHTTALCSPTRAALLSGRNHHSAASGVIMELGTGFPGYNTLMPKSCGTFAEVLKQNGYNTAWYGKNHNVPDWHSSQAGPFDLWPTGLGFEYFYGFIGGDTNQWEPALYENTKPIEPPHDVKDYFFEKDMADQCIDRIRMLSSVAPEKPWLQYYASGTAHAPHHAPKDWIAKFKGSFDQGWDKVREETFARQKQMGIIPANATLTPRPEEIPAWDSLSADQKKVYARMMEVYAAALAYADHQTGRILEAIEDLGQLDNTLVIYIQGDDGASAEGGFNGLLNEMTFFNGIPEDFSEVLKRLDELGSASTFNHYPIGWAHAMNTPLQWTKQVASHFGGTRNGLVISWPARIKDKGSIRTQFHHIIDIAPTILEAVGVQTPSVLNGVPQKPVEGVSMLYTFDAPKAPSQHRTQYFEMAANRAIYDDGWVVCTTPPVAPFEVALFARRRWLQATIRDNNRNPKRQRGRTEQAAKSSQVLPSLTLRVTKAPNSATSKVAPWVSVWNAIDIDDYRWELYHVADDFSQAVDLADNEPAKLRELQDLFWIEAAKYNVLPIDNSRVERLDVSLRPSPTRGRSVFTYYPGQTRIPEGSAPDIKNKSFKIAADIEVLEGGADGVVITQGGRFGGWALCLFDAKPTFLYNTVDVFNYSVMAKDKLAPGRHALLVSFEYDGGGVGKGGKVTISVDDKPIAEGRIERTIPFRVSLDETLDIGEDTGTPVSKDYTVPFHFTGKLNRVLVRLGESKLTAEDEEQIRRAKAAIGISQ